MPLFTNNYVLWRKRNSNVIESNMRERERERENGQELRPKCSSGQLDKDQEDKR